MSKEMIIYGKKAKSRYSNCCNFNYDSRSYFNSCAQGHMALAVNACPKIRR